MRQQGILPQKRPIIVYVLTGVLSHERNCAILMPACHTGKRENGKGKG